MRIFTEYLLLQGQIGLPGLQGPPGDYGPVGPEGPVGKDQLDEGDVKENQVTQELQVLKDFGYRMLFLLLICGVKVNAVINLLNQLLLIIVRKRTVSSAFLHICISYSDYMVILLSQLVQHSLSVV